MAAAAVFLKAGRDAALGVRGFSRTAGWALALRGGGVVVVPTELPHQTPGVTTRGGTCPWSSD